VFEAGLLSAISLAVVRRTLGNNYVEVSSASRKALAFVYLAPRGGPRCRRVPRASSAFLEQVLRVPGMRTDADRCGMTEVRGIVSRSELVRSIGSTRSRPRNGDHDDQSGERSSGGGTFERYRLAELAYRMLGSATTRRTLVSVSSVVVQGSPSELSRP